jgi:hypothetical protein
MMFQAGIPKRMNGITCGFEGSGRPGDSFSRRSMAVRWWTIDGAHTLFLVPTLLRCRHQVKKLITIDDCADKASLKILDPYSPL